MGIKIKRIIFSAVAVTALCALAGCQNTVYLKNVTIENGRLVKEYSDGTKSDGGAIDVKDASEDKIAVLYTNDVHCGLDVTDERMGISGLIGYKALTAQSYEYTALVDCGDFIQGEQIGTVSKGSMPVDIMNYAVYDYGTFGNHEFDYGMDTLIGDGGLVASSNMTYLACNFKNVKTGETVVSPYALEFYGDYTVAYVGIATPETLYKSTPTYFQDDSGEYIYSFCEGDGTALYAAVQESIDAAKSAGADYVVAIAHLGIEEDSAPYRSTDVIKNTTGLDVVLDGHSHSVISGDKVTDKSGNEVLLSSTGTKLQNVGKLVIDTNGTKSKDDDKLTTELVSAATVKATASNTTEARRAQKYLERVESEFNKELNKTVATSKYLLSSTNTTASGKSYRAVRNSETAIGDLCADAYRTVTNADISFVNGGGIRADLKVGEITYSDIIAVHPYGNAVCLIEATGQQIIDALELGAKNTMAAAYEESADGTVNAVGESGGFLNVSGLKYTIDTSVQSTVVTNDKGAFESVSGARRVKNVQVLNKTTGAYEDIDLTKTYTLAGNNYMLKSAGDGYSMFGSCKILLDETMLDNQALISYIQDSLGGVIGEQYSAPQGRITILGR